MRCQRLGVARGVHNGLEPALDKGVEQFDRRVVHEGAMAMDWGLGGDLLA